MEYQPGIFTEFSDAMHKRFDYMLQNSPKLFLVDTNEAEIWSTYLNSFPEGTNPVRKERREYECNSCLSFIKRYGGIVAIINNKLVSIWDVEVGGYYKVVAEAMSQYVKSKPLVELFLTSEKTIGTPRHLVQQSDGTIETFNHFYLNIPANRRFNSRLSEDSVRGEFKNVVNVFRRALEEISISDTQTVLELIAQNSIYRGAEFKPLLESFLVHQKAYASASNKEFYVWQAAEDNAVCRIRSSSIGTLLIDLSKGVDLDTAVRKFESVVAPSNYKRPTSVITKRMIEDAEKTIEELGLASSLGRRHASVDDITVNNVLFVNRETKPLLKGSVLSDLKTDIVVSPKKFDKLQEVTIEDFIQNVLPTADSISVMPEYRHGSNLVTLVAPLDKDAPCMLKWNNNFSWSYKGEVADSIKENVKSAGGKVDGVLRFSIQWNDEHYTPNDFDAHCREPNGNTIYYPNKRMVHPSSGMLDVDIINPVKGKPAVENIIWTNKAKMHEGVYHMYVHNFSNNGGKHGFSAEIEFDGQIYTFHHRKPVRDNAKVTIAKIKFTHKDGFKFTESMGSTINARTMWGIKTGNFEKVSIMMLSPNYWDEQSGIGNKHYFFMLQNCKAEESPRGFYNEFLKEDLNKHRKVFEVLGSKMRVEDSPSQLSGLGFSSTKKDSINVLVEGKTKRLLKVIFN